MIPILDNSPVELTEFFSVNLATNNPFVVFNNNVSSVEIRDNDGMAFSYSSVHPGTLSVLCSSPCGAGSTRGHSGEQRNC